jgi:hypothetical protein
MAVTAVIHATIAVFPAWLIGRVQCFYTILIVCINIVVSLDTNPMLLEDTPKLTPESIMSRIYGSKLVLVVEQSTIVTVWGCKACLLRLYAKLT